MPIISENISYISVEDLVIRDQYGTPTAYNYSGIFSRMKDYLLQFYDNKSYKGRCNNFMHVYGRFYEKARYDGERGIMSGSLIKITSGGENLTYVMTVTDINNTAYSTKRSMLSDPMIMTTNKSSFDIEYREITCTFGTSSSSNEARIRVRDAAYRTNLSSYLGSYSSSKLKVYDSPTVRNIGGENEPCVVENDGTTYSSSGAREPWNGTNNSYFDYMKHTIKEKYDAEIFTWVDAKPPSEQYSMAYDSYMEWQDWYSTPLPVVYTKLLEEKDETTGNVITDIINDDNSSWSDDVIKYPISTKTNWKIYIDGTKLPNYKILWENKDIEELKDTDNTRIQIQYAEVDPEYPVELRVNELIHETNFAEYNDGNYKTNFKTLYEGAWGEVYDESIMSNLPKQSVWLLLQLDYYRNGITTVLPTQSSTKMAILLNPSGKSLYSYADVWNTGGETDGSTIRVITDKGSGEGDDGYKDDTDKGEEDITDGASNSVGVLTTTYAMTIERLNQLGGFLWGANIFDEFSLVNSNPIENIISCKNIPISLSGTDEIIHLGNVDTGTNGSKVASNFSTLNVGQIALPTKYNSFLDFAPYTKITIYLPYIGFKEIDATIAIGKTLKVAYVADVITGGCIAQIFINGVRFYEFSGEMGVDIPITASNRAQVEASYISNAVGMGASLASGNITGAVDSVLASATAKYNYSSTDTPNPNCVASVNRTCYVIIERPTYQELSQFNHTKGKMCNLSRTIGSLKGFTICDANIDLKGITATEQEKQEISSILSSGFFA